MRQRDIKIGDTYMFVATENPSRKHLEGLPYTVVDRKPVFRRQHNAKKASRVYRFLNDNGDEASADELEPMDDVQAKLKADLDNPF